MIYEVPDFIPHESLVSLNKKMLEVYAELLKVPPRQDAPNAPVRKIFRMEQDHFGFAKPSLGKEMLEPAERIREYVKNIYPNAIPRTIGYMYFTPETWVGSYHRDGPDPNIFNTPRHQVLTSMLYTHLEWKPEWEMNLCFERGDVVFPNPNKFIAFTRDERHRVTEPKCTDQNYVRIFLGISWTLV